MFASHPCRAGRCNALYIIDEGSTAIEVHDTVYT